MDDAAVSMAITIQPPSRGTLWDNEQAKQRRECGLSALLASPSLAFGIGGTPPNGNPAPSTAIS
jgi:hypothetical protein